MQFILVFITDMDMRWYSKHTAMYVLLHKTEERHSALLLGCLDFALTNLPCQLAG